VSGNIIVQADGTHDPLDWHSSRRFRERAGNFIIGSHAITLATPKEVDFGRGETLSTLSRVLHRPTAEREIDVMGKMSKLEERQVQNMLKWLGDPKARAARS
jgi:hypothetical protein